MASKPPKTSAPTSTTKKMSNSSDATRPPKVASHANGHSSGTKGTYASPHQPRAGMLKRGC